MSTRLHEHLPKRRSTTPDRRQSTTAAGKENADSNIIVKKRRTTSNQKDVKVGIGEGFDENSTKSSCQTPKSEANRIPQTLTCPPAPKKPTRRVPVLSCKRKLMAEFEFFEADRREEVDEFFRSSFERISAARARGRNDVVAASTSAAVAGGGAESESSSSSPPPLTCN